MVESTRNLHIVLFIGVMCVVLTVAQVCPYSDPRCNCYQDRISCADLQEIPPLNTGVNVSQFTQITFENGNITSISKSSLPPGLIGIYVSGLPLTNISDDAFDSSTTTLQTVQITGAKFTSLPKALKKLTKLNGLFIYGAPIQVWDSATLTQIASTLVHLSLSEVSLSEWPSWMSEFHLLQQVHLSGNPFNSIPDDAFSSVQDSLTILDLSNCSLTKLPQALSTLSSLHTLHLSFNNFTDVSEIQKITELPFAQKLTVLHLGSVGQTRIANFSSLTNLRSINLYRYQVFDIPAGSLPVSLITLSLSDNSLSSVPKDIASMAELSSLTLSNNRITDIEPNSFPSSLTDLDLDHNNLTIITNTTFEDLVHLGDLNLNFNPIATISPSAFSDLVSLEYLNIINSHLTEIPLALTQLRPQTLIVLTIARPLSCPCPASPDLVQWFASLGVPSYIDAACSNGQSIGSYMIGKCGQSSVSL